MAIQEASQKHYDQKHCFHSNDFDIEAALQDEPHEYKEYLFPGKVENILPEFITILNTQNAAPLSPKRHR